MATIEGGENNSSKTQPINICAADDANQKPRFADTAKEIIKRNFVSQRGFFACAAIRAIAIIQSKRRC
jgi:hypothetical protein